MALHTVPLDRFKPGQCLVITQGDYFGSQIKAAGVVERLEVDQVPSFLHLRLTGSTSEGILKVHTSGQPRTFKAHPCQVDCQRLESGNAFFMPSKDV